MSELKTLPPANKDPSPPESAAFVIIDCGGVRESTLGAPVGFWSEAGWPPYIRFTGA